MKLIMWIIIGYLGYKFWLQPKLLQGGSNSENNASNQQRSSHEDDYVDYEEVDD